MKSATNRIKKDRQFSCSFMVRLRYLLPGQYTAKGHDHGGKCCSDSFLRVTCPFFARELVARTYACAARGMFGPVSYVQVTSLWPHLNFYYFNDTTGL